MIHDLRSRSWLLLVALLLLSAPGSAGAQNNGLDRLDDFLGEWDVVSLAPDGETIVGRARTQVRRILDGTTLQADYYGLDPSGNTIFRGTTIRTWVPATDSYVVHWAMAGMPGYTYLLEEYVDGELHAEGHGVDAQGEFLERYRYFDIDEGHYSFEMERSYDDGDSWQPWASLRATRR